jgi:hypothetical protein
MKIHIIPVGHRAFEKDNQPPLKKKLSPTPNKQILAIPPNILIQLGCARGLFQFTSSEPHANKAHQDHEENVRHGSTD